MHLLGLIVFMLCFLMVFMQERKTIKQPNIIIIVADDVGWNDFGLHGSGQIPTPNIDALGLNGVILDKFYTQQSCTPSRAALLTGKYPMRLGLQGFPLDAGENRYLPLDSRTMPEVLKELGYKTHLIGKWHLGAACKEHTPTRRGFDTHFGYWNGYVGYFNYEVSVPDPINKNATYVGFDLRDNFVSQWGLRGQYATELFSKKAVEVIEEHNTKKPLFLMMTHLAGHTGYDGVELGVPNVTRADEKYSYIKNSKRRLYADIINIMDWSVGEIVKKLSDKGMLENSIILFFSDNGAQTEGLYENYGSSWPYRGLKFTLFEGGVRGTGVVYSPLFQKKNYVNRHLMHITDFLPTFYHAAGGDVSALGNIDGFNQWEVISKNKTTKRTDILLNIDEVNGYSGMLGFNGQYKLLNGTFFNGTYASYYGDSGRSPEDPPYDIESTINSPTNLAIQKLKNTIPLNSTNIQDVLKEVEVGDCRSTSELFLCNDMCLFDVYTDRCETKNLIKDDSLKNVVVNLKKKYLRYLNQVVPQTPKKIEPESNPIYFNNTWSPWLKCRNSFTDSFFDMIQRWYAYFYYQLVSNLFVGL